MYTSRDLSCLRCSSSAFQLRVGHRYLIYLAPGAQSHGRRTKYAVMLDADMSIPAAWRLRVTLQRVAQLCATWDQDPLCFQAFQVPIIVEGIKFFTNRIFPTSGAGTSNGWHYTYPVHEVSTCPY